MKKILNNKNILIIIGIVIVAIILILFIVMSGSFKSKNNTTDEYKADKKDKLQTNLIKFTNDFYENNYYNLLKDKSLLENYTENGINLSITSINMVVKLDEETKTMLNNKDCDYDESKVFIYPTKPFGNKDYKVKVELSCKK